MFRLFVSRTSPRRPRSATPEVEALEKIISLSSTDVSFSNLGNVLLQSIRQKQSETVTADVYVDATADASYSKNSNAANTIDTDVKVEGGDQSQDANNYALQSSDTQINGGVGSGN